MTHCIINSSGSTSITLFKLALFKLSSLSLGVSSEHFHTLVIPSRLIELNNSIINVLINKPICSWSHSLERLHIEDRSLRAQQVLFKSLTCAWPQAGWPREDHWSIAKLCFAMFMWGRGGNSIQKGLSKSRRGTALVGDSDHTAFSCPNIL